MKVQNLSRLVYLFNCFDRNVLEKFQNCYKHLKKCGDAKKFNATFYPDICLHVAEAFQTFAPRVATVMCTKLANKLIVHFKEGNQNTGKASCQISNKSMSHKEIAGLEYLEGYVFSKLCRTILHTRNPKSPGNEQSISLLKACQAVEDENASKLVQAVLKSWRLVENYTCSMKYFYED